MEEKKDLEQRGIGITKGHIYIEPAAEAQKKTRLIVSVSDSYQDTDIAVVVRPVSDGKEGKSLKADTDDAHCDARIAGSDLFLCRQDVTYLVDADTLYRVHVTYGTTEKIIDVGPENRDAWIDWLT